MRKIERLFLSILTILLICSCSDYDWDKPDTKANRNGFATFLGVNPTDEVVDIYFFADEWGSDSSYWFAFSAPQSLVDKIIEKWHLILIQDRSDIYMPPTKELFHWWNLDERRKSQYYEYRDLKKKVDCYLWYNPENKKCQVAIIGW